MATMDGEIVGEDKPFSGIAEFFNGKWVDDEDGEWSINDLPQGELVTHGWMMPPSWE